MLEGHVSRPMCTSYRWCWQEMFVVDRPMCACCGQCWYNMFDVIWLLYVGQRQWGQVTPDVAWLLFPRQRWCRNSTPNDSSAMCTSHNRCGQSTGNAWWAMSDVRTMRAACQTSIGHWWQYRRKKLYHIAVIRIGHGWCSLSTLVVSRALCTSLDQCGNPRLVSPGRCFFLWNDVAWSTCIRHKKYNLSNALRP